MFKSLLFVVVQFVCLGLIAITGPLIPSSTLLFVIELAGIGLGIWAVLSMRFHFNIAPDPLLTSKLVTSGPYKLIRHPMYMAILLTTLPLIIDRFNIIQLSIWLILLTVLLLKMNYEENVQMLSGSHYMLYTDLIKEVGGYCMDMGSLLFDPPVDYNAIEDHIGKDSFKAMLPQELQFPSGKSNLPVIPDDINDPIEKHRLQVIAYMNQLMEVFQSSNSSDVA